MDDTLPDTLSDAYALMRSTLQNQMIVNDGIAMTIRELAQRHEKTMEIIWQIQRDNAKSQALVASMINQLAALRL
jgi:uncharacterized membrane protein YccC